MKSIARNVGLSWVSQILYVGCQLARVSILYLIFEEGARGTWFLMVSIIGFAAYLEMGFTGAFTRFYARSYGVGENESPEFLKETRVPHFGFEDLAANAKVVFNALGGISFVLSFAGGILFLHRFDTFRSFSGGVTVAWLLLSLGQSLTLVGYQYSAALQGKGYVGLDSLLKTWGAIFSLILLIPVLLFRGSLIYVAFVEMLRGTFTLISFYYYCKAHVPEYFAAKPRWRKDVLGILWRSSMMPFLAGLGAALLSNTDPLYIASFLNVRKVSDYYNLHQLVSQLFAFSVTITVSGFPALLTLFGSGNVSAYRELYRKIHKHSVLLYGLAGGYLFFFGKPILELWLGFGHFAGYPILIALLLYFFIELENSIFNNAQFSVEKFPIVWAYWGAALLRFGFSYYFILKFGLLGVVLSKLAAQIFTTAWVSPFFCLKTMGAWPPKHSLFREGLQVYFPVVVFLAIGGFARIMTIGAWPYSFVLQTACYFVLSITVSYFFLEPEMRDNMMSRFRRLLAFAPE